METRSPPDMDYALALFRAHLADARRSPRTTERYVRVLKEFAREIRSATPAESWTLDDVEHNQIVRFLRGASSASQPAPSTHNVKLSALRAFFGFLRDQGMIARDPSQNIQFATARRGAPTFLTAREYERLLRVVRRVTPPELRARNEAIIVLLFHTGLRVSELQSLTLDMLDANAKVFRNVRLKNGKFAPVEWNREAERALTEWLSVRAKWNTPASVRALFVSKRGHALTVRAIQDAFAHYSKKARVGKRITAHVLRHSMATELLRKGVDIRVIAGILHHSSLETTKGYAHLLDETRRRALSLLEPCGSALPLRNRRKKR